jgi:hypothetical protein
MQKVLVELPFYAALELLLESVDACIKVFEDAEVGSLMHHLKTRYEDVIQTLFGSGGNLVPLRRGSA